MQATDVMHAPPAQRREAERQSGSPPPPRQRAQAAGMAYPRLAARGRPAARPRRRRCRGGRRPWQDGRHGHAVSAATCRAELADEVVVPVVAKAPSCAGACTAGDRFMRATAGREPEPQAAADGPRRLWQDGEHYSADADAGGDADDDSDADPEVDDIVDLGVALANGEYDIIMPATGTDTGIAPMHSYMPLLFNDTASDDDDDAVNDIEGVYADNDDNVEEVVTIDHLDLVIEIVEERLRCLRARRAALAAAGGPHSLPPAEPATGSRYSAEEADAAAGLSESDSDTEYDDWQEFLSRPGTEPTPALRALLEVRRQQRRAARRPAVTGLPPGAETWGNFVLRHRSWSETDSLVWRAYVAHMDGQADENIDGQADESISGQADEPIDGQADEQIAGLAAGARLIGRMWLDGSHGAAPPEQEDSSACHSSELASTSDDENAILIDSSDTSVVSITSDTSSTTSGSEDTERFTPTSPETFWTQTTAEVRAAEESFTRHGLYLFRLHRAYHLLLMLKTARESSGADEDELASLHITLQDVRCEARAVLTFCRAAARVAGRII
jgi:hypothetical protein